MNQANQRLQAAMDCIHGGVATIGLPPLEVTSYNILRDVREALNEPVTTLQDALPGIAEAKQTALAKIYEIATDPRISELALAGLYGCLPREAA